MTGANDIITTVKELSHYFGAALKLYIGLEYFNHQHKMSTPEIICKCCPTRALPCDELIVKLQAKAMNKAIGANDNIAAKAREEMLKIYENITDLLAAGSLDIIRSFMATIAQEKDIRCEDCEKVAWLATGISKS